MAALAIEAKRQDAKYSFYVEIQIKQDLDNKVNKLSYCLAHTPFILEAMCYEQGHFKFDV